MEQALQINDILAASRRFPAVDAAAALRACGWRVFYKQLEQRNAGGAAHAWMVRDRISAAQDLLRRAALEHGPESLPQRSPGHPFLAALYACTALRWLRQWCATDHVPAAVSPHPGSGLCTLAAPGAAGDLMPLLWAVPHVTSPIALATTGAAAFTAAAIAVGFLPRPQLTGATVPELHMPEQSFTFPTLTAEQLHTATAVATPALAAFAAALHAGLKWQEMCAHEQRTLAHRTVLMRCRGTGSVIVNSLIWDTEDPAHAVSRDAIAEHLAFA